jgi:hypothetical protein
MSSQNGADPYLIQSDLIFSEDLGRWWLAATSLVEVEGIVLQVYLL